MRASVHKILLTWAFCPVASLRDLPGTLGDPDGCVDDWGQGVVNDVGVFSGSLRTWWSGVILGQL